MPTNVEILTLALFEFQSGWTGVHIGSLGLSLTGGSKPFSKLLETMVRSDCADPRPLLLKIHQIKTSEYLMKLTCSDENHDLIGNHLYPCLDHLVFAIFFHVRSRLLRCLCSQIRGYFVDQQVCLIDRIVFKKLIELNQTYLLISFHFCFDHESRVDVTNDFLSFLLQLPLLEFSLFLSVSSCPLATTRCSVTKHI